VARLAKMTAVGWREETISKQHDRKNFDCGIAAVNDSLERFARQNHQSGGVKTFVAVSPAAPAQILGYYSISPGAVEFARALTQLAKGLGRYEVPFSASVVWR
jgi:hypothetical protein